MDQPSNEDLAALDLLVQLGLADVFSIDGEPHYTLGSRYIVTAPEPSDFNRTRPSVCRRYRYRARKKPIASASHDGANRRIALLRCELLARCVSKNSVQVLLRHRARTDEPIRGRRPHAVAAHDGCGQPS
jgi:hypothetical protein